jgi:hypothetical protein
MLIGWWDRRLRRREKKSQGAINRRERNKLTLFVVKPKLIFLLPINLFKPRRDTQSRKPIEGEKPKIIQVLRIGQFTPDANRGIAVLGIGSGKTAEDRSAIRSAIDQGF